MQWILDKLGEGKGSPYVLTTMFQLRVLARERKEDIIAIHCDTSEDHQDHGE